MFGKKLKLRNIIDKHQDFFVSQPIPNDESDTNMNRDDKDMNITEDSFEHLIYGFIREITTLIPYISNNNVTNAMIKKIIKICLNFYNTGFEKFENLKFDLYNNKYCSLLYNTIINANPSGDNISCHRVFTTSIGYKFGVHKWKIKYVVNDKKSLSTPYGGIGIISDNNILKKDNKFGNGLCDNYKQLHWINNRSFGNVYYFDQGSKCIYNYMYGKGKVLYSLKHMKNKNISYNKGDIITIVLDCNRWTIKILRNDQNILKDDKEIIIKKKYIAYYPVIAFYHHGDTYRVLKFSA
eukprot:458361_1